MEILAERNSAAARCGRHPLLVSLLVVAALLFAACGGSDSSDDAAVGLNASSDDSSSTSSDDSAAEASGLQGSVSISGSSTVEPVSVRVAELFESSAPDVEVTVDGPGTGDGFKLFCAGETDVSDASRQIKDAEAELCAEAGIDWIELRVGIDGIAVMTSQANTAVDCVSFPELYALVGPEATGATWADANALSAEVGGGELPDAPLDIYGPGEESGTFDSFIEIVLEDLAEERGQDATTRPDYNAAADDNVILSGIEGADTSLGWVGFAFAVNSNAKLLAVSEEQGGDCVPATPDTIASGEYPISRALYIYVNAAEAEANPALAAYIDFYVSDAGLGQAVSDVGYVELTDDSKAETRAAWTSRAIG